VKPHRGEARAGDPLRALSRLEGRDLIEALPSEDRRRPYRITARGSAALAEQLRMLDRVVDTGMKRLRAAGAAS
jgi:DNA-binding PadR family transcriptional regulator